jgi:LacI family transcriptional regulator
MKENNLLHGMIIASRMPLSVVAAIQRELPLVILNNKIGNGEICCVDCDYVRAAWLAVSHLIKAGHRRIVFVYESVSHPELWQHQSGYRLAFETNDLKSPEIFLSAGVNEELFERNIINFFSSNKDVTALYTRHNLTAERIIKTLGGMGIRIPDDISVVTTGDFENCRLPGGAVISCADTRIGEMCSIAMETVAMEMRGRKINENWNILEPEFKAGDTVKNI